jgi:hypothetical protein
VRRLDLLGQLGQVIGSSRSSAVRSAAKNSLPGWRAIGGESGQIGPRLVRGDPAPESIALAE